MCLKKTSASKPDEAPKVQDGAKIDLEMYFHSALASALTFQLNPDNHREANDPEREQEYRAGVLKRIEDEFQKITELGLKSSDGSRRAYTFACAVAKNAFGLALSYQSQFKAAETKLREAITLTPDFVDAYLNLAEILMKAKSRLDLNWIQEAQAQLDQALLLSPSSQRAHYLLGRLQANPAIGEFTAAKENFSKAELIPWSYYFRAQIIKNQDHDLKQAIQVLGKSIARFPRVDYRYEAYVRWTITFLEANTATAGSDQSLAEYSRILLDNALSAARKLQKHGIDEKLRTQGEDLVNKLNVLQKGLHPNEANQKEGGGTADSHKTDSLPGSV
jgi:tetratricopeptide (TPR) repeat protein